MFYFLLHTPSGENSGPGYPFVALTVQEFFLTVGIILLFLRSSLLADDPNTWTGLSVHNPPSVSQVAHPGLWDSKFDWYHDVNELVDELECGASPLAQVDDQPPPPSRPLYRQLLPPDADEDLLPLNLWLPLSQSMSRALGWSAKRDLGWAGNSDSEREAEFSPGINANLAPANSLLLDLGEPYDTGLGLTHGNDGNAQWVDGQPSLYHPFIHGRPELSDWQVGQGQEETAYGQEATQTSAPDVVELNIGIDQLEDTDGLDDNTELIVPPAPALQGLPSDAADECDDLLEPLWL